MSCSSKFYLDRASRSSTHPAGSCSSTGKSPAPRSRRAEEDHGGPVAAVTVGDDGRIVFISAHNSTANPAVDTVAVGATVTWTWTNNLGGSHSVPAQGATAVAGRPIMGGSGQTDAVTFTAPGTYPDDCAVHGTAMAGTIVVR